MEKKLVFLFIRLMLGTLSKQGNLFTLVRIWRRLFV